MRFLLIALIISISFYLILFDVSQTDYKKTVYLKGLGVFNKTELYTVEKTIEKFFDFDCVVLDDSVKDLRDSINCDDLQYDLTGHSNFIFEEDEPITIFVTNSDIYSLGINLSGVSYGNQIYLNSTKIGVPKSVTIHEISHTLGLEHCENLCVMNINYTPQYSNKIWNNTTDEPVFCENCKSKLP